MSFSTWQKGKGKLGHLDLEGALTARDRVGIQDFVLLDAHNSETAFLDNLKKRFSEDLIYTYIGTLLISVNPYKELDIYNKKHMDLYMGVNFYELPPHIYALADNAYHTMLTEGNNHFILISGESGAGKTEASKKILQYYAVSCPSSALLDTVRDRMLMSNPVLEAFGNAKTLKNDNSSRFGKYMDIQFDRQGDAVGGHILSYLLEKSRVVHQNHGERNFHIFYQLVEGGEEDLLRQLGLERDTQHYNYLVGGECANVSSINDKNDWKTVKNALSVIHFDESDIEHLFGVIASVLHLGNVHFDGDTKGYAVLNSNAELRWVSKVLMLSNSDLGFQVMCPFMVDHAVYVRDALAKAIYGRTFTWLVNRINESLENQDSTRKTVIGLLDIYGFEVFYVNSFEQFCINYCNEKLQQLFIQLTLKAEQEEYEAEGIEWEPVQFFNNKIICDLVEEKYRGIISVLDEECLRPGDATDLTFLEKLEEKMGNHPHFVTHKLADKKTRKTLDRGDFRLLHYAGEVTYCVVGFIDKNNDLLYRHIKEVSGLKLRDYAEVATQFKNSLLELTEILMAKEAWYVRCLKSNDNKQSGKFDDVLVRHQVKYLGLIEHLRVRRAGFAYRRRYEEFLKRYKPLCPDTWPHWRGVAADGVETLVKHLGYQPDEYKMGRTKIFIRYARTLFATEDAFEICKHELATRIQAKYKGYRAKGEFKKQKEAGESQIVWIHTSSKFECAFISVVRRFIKGYMTRGQAKTTDNSEYLAFVRQSYLNRLKGNLPKTVLDKTTWLTPPPVMKEVLTYLQELFLNRVSDRCCLVESSWFKTEQIFAIFKGKKDSYPQSVAVPFQDTRISQCTISSPSSPPLLTPSYSVPVVKYDRNGFKPRPRQLILTQSAAYLVEEAKIKQRADYVSLKGGYRTLCLGDLLLQCDHLYEFLTKLSVLANKQNAIKVLQGSIKFEIQGGKENFVDFSTGQEPLVYKGKNGHLTVSIPSSRTF
uniref:Myosin motor domain-containing protein n=1 Tax=Pygocentrus nattereri TaxID=42514 RepID=A0A3B4CG41_PYGNA